MYRLLGISGATLAENKEKKTTKPAEWSERSVKKKSGEELAYATKRFKYHLTTTTRTRTETTIGTTIGTTITRTTRPIIRAVQIRAIRSSGTTKGGSSGKGISKKKAENLQEAERANEVEELQKPNPTLPYQYNQTNQLSNLR